MRQIKFWSNVSNYFVSITTVQLFLMCLNVFDDVLSSWFRVKTGSVSLRLVVSSSK